MNILLLSLLVSLAIQLVLFIPAFTFKTDKLTDASYSLTFMILSVIFFVTSEKSIAHLILLIMVLSWALRIGTYLVIRITKMKKDVRFDGVREHLGKFLKFWVLQGIAVWAVMLSSSIYYSINAPTLDVVSCIGIIVFIIGLLLESIADQQKFMFSNNPKNKNTFITTGLWRYSRHPNYFGEFLIWLGIFIFTLSSKNIFSLLGIISPLFIWYILLYGTGVPMLEKYYDKKFAKNKQWFEYKKNTHKFLLWYPKNGYEQEKR